MVIISRKYLDTYNIIFNNIFTDSVIVAGIIKVAAVVSIRDVSLKNFIVGRIIEMYSISSISYRYIRYNSIITII